MDHLRLVASVRDRLRNISEKSQEDFESVLIRYVVERFLYRLSLSPQNTRYVLKGATLYAMWEDAPRRATRDIDFLARGDGSAAQLESDIQAICCASVDDDGLVFDLSKMAVVPIREDTEYGGTRIRFRALLGNIRVPVQIDFGVGDVVTPDPVLTDYPSLLGLPKPRILAYPVETVIAEKLNAIVMRGLANSRMKDYYDLLHFAKSDSSDRETVAKAVAKTFARREQSIPTDVPPGLTDEFANYPEKLDMWRRFQDQAELSMSLADAVIRIREFAMPIFEEATALRD